MPTTCVIGFENPAKVFYAGQLLRGTVCLTLTNEKKIRGIYVQIFGRAYAYWKKYHSNDYNQNGHHVSYTGNEEYLNEKIYFVGGSSGELQLEPGTYNYIFQCMLPPGLPTSVQHSVGHITYGAKLILDIPLQLNEEYKQNFTVIKMVNLNADPSFRCPAEDREECQFYPLGFLFCIVNDKLKIDTNTPVSGYCPGQTINVTIKVNNESKHAVDQFNVKLIKEITFHALGMHDGRHERSAKSFDIFITGENTRGCAVGERDTIHVDLHVPSIPPTDFTTSNIVHVKYSIRITAKLSSCWRKYPVLKLPITIGTYPLLDDNTGGVNSTDVVFSMQPTAPQLPNGSATDHKFPIPILPNASNTPSAPIEPYPSDDPPTYEEAMASEGDSSNTFKPKYPMFRRQMSYSNQNTGP